MLREMSGLVQTNAGDNFQLRDTYLIQLDGTIDEELFRYRVSINSDQIVVQIHSKSGWHTLAISWSGFAQQAHRIQTVLALPLLDGWMPEEEEEE